MWALINGSLKLLPCHAPNARVKLFHFLSACQKLMLRLSFAASSHLAGLKWGLVFARVGFNWNWFCLLLKEAAVIDSNVAQLPVNPLLRSNGVGRPISLGLAPNNTQVVNLNLWRKPGRNNAQMCVGAEYNLCAIYDYCTFSFLLLICLPCLLRKHLMRPLFQIWALLYSSSVLLPFLLYSSMSLSLSL